MNVRDIRDRAGMSRSAFAEYFGISYRTIQNWELGEGNSEGRKCPKYLLELMKYKLEHDRGIDFSKK